MIPKTIHYCWFGRGQMPKLAEKCMASWHKYCPDYEFVLWNEDTFDISSVPYVKEAYENRKFAFVTDYVRLYAMVEYGGIYMDTDVEVLKPLDEYLKHRAFSGFESSADIPTGIMASEKDFPLYQEFLEYYVDRHFVREDGSLDTTTNVKIMTNICKSKGLVQNGKEQCIEGWMLYPSEVFCPLNNATGELECTKNTATIHWFAKSWISPKQRLISKMARPFHKAFGADCFAWLRGK